MFQGRMFEMLGRSTIGAGTRGSTVGRMIRVVAELLAGDVVPRILKRIASG